MIDWKRTGPVLVTCPRGIAPFLARELAGLGLGQLEELDLGVRAEGTLTDCMKLCLHSRLGHKVLFELASFKAADPEWLYRGARKVAWEDILPADGYVSVSSAVNTRAVDNSMFAALKLKDAIVDRMRRETGRRPDSGREARGASVFLHWEGSRATISLDLAGEPLSRRGYRVSPHAAPMQETLAAAAVLASGYETGNFVNPMCGSGTLAIEAALLALGRAPGSIREYHAFRHLLGYEPKVWEDLLADAALDRREEPGGRIIATDRDPKAIEAARRNAALAGVDGAIEFSVCDYADTPMPEDSGVVLVNPEYGERLGKSSQLGEVYAGIGDFFKQRCRGYTGAIFTGNLALAKRVGLRTRRRIELWNAKIECRLLLYDLYAGTRKGEG